MFRGFCRLRRIAILHFIEFLELMAYIDGATAFRQTKRICFLKTRRIARLAETVHFPN